MNLLGHPYSYGPVITCLEILTSNWAKLLLAARGLGLCIQTIPLWQPVMSLMNRKLSMASKEH